jgi:hypothetical protein
LQAADSIADVTAPRTKKTRVIDDWRMICEDGIGEKSRSTAAGRQKTQSELTWASDPSNLRGFSVALLLLVS